VRAIIPALESRLAGKANNGGGLGIRIEIDADLTAGRQSDLTARAKAGDKGAFDAILRPLFQPAYHLAYVMLRDREAAEDAVQEAALKTWRKLPSMRPGTDLRPWFLGFVANECRNSRRSRWRAVLRLGERDDIPSPDPTWVSDPDLLRALVRLPSRDRLLVLLHFYLDMGIEEIAVITGSRASATRSRLYRAVKRMRPHLDGGEAAHD
jgi:RNA polymerase sigma-70 factor, ECF subfamily